MFDSITPERISPPSLHAEVFDEKQLKREWDEACGDEQDAVERKAAILRKALARWPMVLPSNPGLRAQGIMVYSPEMRRFVRDVLGLPDARQGGINDYARKLVRDGVARTREQRARSDRKRVQIKHAAIQAITEYRLGRKPEECMEALAKFYEESINGQA